jgi:flagellar basal body P-ring protein FlgI
MTLSDRPSKLRWPRAQRFSLSTQGAAAESAYRDQIVASRTETGRASFDAARKAWAQTHALQVDDGLYLAEVAGGGVSLTQIVESLENCGKSRSDAIAALERLADAGMLTPLAEPAPSYR